MVFTVDGLRKILLRLPESLRTVQMPQVGYVLGLGLDGNIVYNLQDPTGNAYAFITSVTEYEGALYLGSVVGDALGSVPVP